MKKTTTVKAFLLVALLPLWLCVACTKQTAPAPAAKPEPIAATDHNCGGLSELLAIAGSKDAITLDLDVFIAKYSAVLAIESRDAENSFPYMASFKASKGDWLLKSSASYSQYDVKAPTKLLLETAKFTINPVCVPKPAELDTFLEKALGNPTTKDSATDSNTGSEWRWQKEDEYSLDFINFFLSKEGEVSLSIGRQEVTNEGEN